MICMRLISLSIALAESAHIPEQILINNTVLNESLKCDVAFHTREPNTTERIKLHLFVPDHWCDFS